MNLVHWAGAALLLLLSPLWLALLLIGVTLWVIWQPVSLVWDFTYGVIKPNAKSEKRERDIRAWHRRANGVDA